MAGASFCGAGGWGPAATAVCPSPLHMLGGRRLALCSSRPFHFLATRGCQTRCDGRASPSTKSAGFPRTVRTSEKPTLSASLQPHPACARTAAVWGLGPYVPEGLSSWSPLAWAFFMSRFSHFQRPQ